MSQIEEKKLHSYLIILKYEPFRGSNIDYLGKTKHHQAEHEKLKERFFRVINKVVELGGVIYMDKYKLDHEHRMIDANVHVKITKDMIEQLIEHPCISEIKELL